MITQLRTGHDATKAAARLAIRHGEAAFKAGLPRYPEPYREPLNRGAYRQGWDQAAKRSAAR